MSHDRSHFDSICEILYDPTLPPSLKKLRSVLRLRTGAFKKSISHWLVAAVPPVSAGILVGVIGNAVWYISVEQKKYARRVLIGTSKAQFDDRGEKGRTF
jgi:hypothetical protein